MLLNNSKTAAKMGRKKIPTEIKQLRGTDRADRCAVNQMKPEPYVSIPLPPEHLGEIGKREWTVIVSNYIQLGMLSALDSGMIAAYCTQVELYIEANTELKDKSKLIKVKNADGSLKGYAPHPLLKVANDALDRAIRIASELGLTPAARTKISMGQIAATKPATPNNTDEAEYEFDI